MSTKSVASPGCILV